MADELPSPPFPDPDSPVLKLIVDEAYRAYETGEAGVGVAIIHAAVNAWLEGHLEGEECVRDCRTNARWQGYDELTSVGFAPAEHDLVQPVARLLDHRGNRVLIDVLGD